MDSALPSGFGKSNSRLHHGIDVSMEKVRPQIEGFLYEGNL
jgi:hypothetical protein